MGKDGETSEGVRLDGRLAGLVIAILGAFGGGFGSNYLWVRANPESFSEMVRPDPFTGAEGRELERKLDSVAAQLRELGNRVERHNPEEVVQRITVLELEVRRIKQDITSHGVKEHD